MIESGAYEEWVTRNGVSSMLFRYESWGCFGSASLIFPHTAYATVIAKKNGALWALNCAEYRSLVARQERNILKQKEICIESLPFISRLPRAAKEILIDGIKLLRFKKDNSIINESIHSNGLYYILSGNVLIKFQNQKNVEEAIGPGEHFGDLSMFSARLSSTQAVALENCEILFLSVGSFERLLGPFNQMAFPDDYGVPLMGFGRWDDSFKISLYRELRTLIVEYRNSGVEDFLNFGLEYYKKQEVMKKTQEDREADDGQALEVVHGDSGDGCGYFNDGDILMMPEPEISAEDVTYEIEGLCPNKNQVTRIMDILKSIPIFGALPDVQLEKVVSAMQLITVYSGHYVVKSGKLGQYFYVIEEGEFRTV
uniref:cAMP-dependent protein kinase type II-alpha regulatory subunit n=1 Tax=Lygus hesperus TaxID=30085 RepID=A0A0A9Z6R3_LYGHE